MTDWLDDILDRDPPASVPEGFAQRVVEAAQRESSTRPLRLQLPQFLGLATAAALLLAAGFWMGHGARPLHQEPVLGSGPEHAEMNLEELYRNREILQDFDILSDENLDSVFIDAQEGTWVLDYSMEEAQ